MFLRLLTICAIFKVTNAWQVPYQYSISLADLHARNLQILQQTVSKGWSAFCDSVDEGVMYLLENINPSDAVIYTFTTNNQLVELPIKALTQLTYFDIKLSQPTLVFVNGFYIDDSRFNIAAHLKMLQGLRRDWNIIILDFTRDLYQLYFTVKHHLHIQAYFTAELLSELIQYGIDPKTISLVGLSSGANIAALAAEILYEELLYVKLGQFVALDPAAMCKTADARHINEHISEQVIVMHGGAENFGVNRTLSNIDFFTHAVSCSQSTTYKLERQICKHVYPFFKFVESFIEGSSIPVAKCANQQEFLQNSCYNKTSLDFSLTKTNNLQSGMYIF